MGESIQAVHIAGNGQVITQEKSGILKSWMFVGGEYKLRNDCPCEGGYCRSIMIRNDILIAPSPRGSLQAVELEDMKCVQTFVPTSSDNLGNVTCLQKVDTLILVGDCFYILAHLYCFCRWSNKAHCLSCQDTSQATSTFGIIGHQTAAAKFSFTHA